jgi:hypothetical protein
MKKILYKLFNFDKKNNTEESYVFIPNEKYTFLVLYQNHEIGYLTIENKIWLFEYSVWFKSQNELQPLFEFQDLDKIYEYKSLWPFFSNRIPSEKQPIVEEYFKVNPTHKGDLIELLKEFGNSSVNNPYKLVHTDIQ